ncbi:hypothetical protein ACEYW6_34595 [Nostoc sp. UIC 10607]|uniref:hypothetical protein n=1 Tax=Nostoc sp. UIC 10607 TaxID=3045935 RepID=UPI0039A33311
MPFGTAIARAAQAIITFIMMSDRLTQSLFVPVYLARISHKLEGRGAEGKELVQ